jgi:hypothetical protein
VGPGVFDSIQFFASASFDGHRPCVAVYLFWTVNLGPLFDGGGLDFHHPVWGTPCCDFSSQHGGNEVTDAYPSADEKRTPLVFVYPFIL